MRDRYVFFCSFIFFTNLFYHDASLTLRKINTVKHSDEREGRVTDVLKLTTRYPSSLDLRGEQGFILIPFSVVDRNFSQHLCLQHPQRFEKQNKVN